MVTGYRGLFRVIRRPNLKFPDSAAPSPRRRASRDSEWSGPRRRPAASPLRVGPCGPAGPPTSPAADSSARPERAGPGRLSRSRSQAPSLCEWDVACPSLLRAGSARPADRRCRRRPRALPACAAVRVRPGEDGFNGRAAGSAQDSRGRSGDGVGWCCGRRTPFCKFGLSAQNGILLP